MREGYERRFEHDEIVYWVDYGRKQVEYGIVDEQWSDCVCVDLLAHKCVFTVEGVPLSDWGSDYDKDRRIKLPKGYCSLNPDARGMLLRMIDYKPTADYYDVMNASMSMRTEDKDSIKRMYDMGYLIRKQPWHDGYIEFDIDKGTFAPYWKYCGGIRSKSIPTPYVYSMYDEAKTALEEYLAECERVCGLTEEQWMTEIATEKVEMWAKMYCVPDRKKQDTLAFILSMPEFPMIDVRIFSGHIQCSNLIRTKDNGKRRWWTIDEDTIRDFRLYHEHKKKYANT